MKEQPFSASAGGISAEFGYYPRSCDLDADRFSIRTLADLNESMATVNEHPGVVRHWIYPGAQRQRNVFNGKTRAMPYSSRVFGLPKTHVLTLNHTTNPEDLEFVVWCLSFFSGMRMTTSQAGFLDATPMQPGKLVDFVLRGGCNEGDIVNLALNYLDVERGNQRATKRVAAVIHALFLSQYPQSLSFERFQYLYMALDACYKVIAVKETKRPDASHGGRVQWMCEKFAIPVPSWARDAQKAPSALSVVRNDAFHEALFFDEPLGFSIHGSNQPAADHGNTSLQMQALICRLLVAILGKHTNSYVTSPVDTRQRHGLDLRE